MSFSRFDHSLIRRVVFSATLLVCGLSSSVACRKDVPPPAPRPVLKAVVPVANTDNDDRRGDVIFVHGLGSSDVDAFRCEATEFYFPQEFGKEFKDLGIWTVNYSANVSDWLGTTMPIVDRSKSLLENLSVNGIGYRPVVFIAHSMGGIVVKQMLRDAATLNNEDWKDLSERTRGVVFLATPNAGSDLASALLVAERYLKNLAPGLRVSGTAQELSKNAPMLRDLNIWYRNNVADLQIETKVFYESPLKGNQLVVDEVSSDPGISGVTPIRVDADHIQIAKPRDQNDIVYASTRRFVDREVLPLPAKWEISFEDFVTEFSKMRNDDLKLAAFKAQHKNQEVTWDVIIRNTLIDEKSPSYAAAANEHAPASDLVMLNFRPKRFNATLKPGTKVRISGVFKNTTNALGAIFEQCKFVDIR